MIASAVGALCFICAITAGVADLTTRGAGLPSPACILAVTKFLALEATQWIRYVWCDRYSYVTNMKMFRDAWCLEGNDESISISSASRVVSDCDVCYV